MTKGLSLAHNPTFGLTSATRLREDRQLRFAVLQAARGGCRGSAYFAAVVLRWFKELKQSVPVKSAPG